MISNSKTNLEGKKSCLPFLRERVGSFNNRTRLICKKKSQLTIQIHLVRIDIGQNASEHTYF